MKTRLLVALGILLIASPVPAQLDPNPDGIGVYFDQGGINCPEIWPAPYTTVTAYLLGTRLTRGGCSGWEATLLINPTSFPAGITLDTGSGALNVLTAPEFQVGLSPARMGSVVVFVTVSTLYLGGPVVFGVGPLTAFFDGATPSSEGAGPAYADPTDPSIVVTLTASSSMPWTLPIYRGANTTLPPNGPYLSSVVASINSGSFLFCGDAAESATWGGVKALYGS
jgi:hypothetical protein